MRFCQPDIASPAQATAVDALRGPNGRCDMGGIGALASTCLEEAALTHPGQQRFKHELFRLPRDQPGPELAQHGMVEARVGPLEAYDIFPVDATAHRVSCLAVGQALGKQHDGYEGEGPGRSGWLPTSRK